MELERTDHWEVFTLIPEFIKHNFATYRDECISANAEREG